MSTQKFTDTHNMVAFLSKPAESEGFEQIVDFLNANPIKYALTINPTIYTSCIEQFWATAKVKNYQWGSTVTSPSRWKKVKAKNNVRLMMEKLAIGKNRKSDLNAIGVNAGDLKLMLLSINLLLVLKVNADMHKLTTAGES
ncbi:hypothetical protein Tco_0162490 [Tanacetum coccineum]